MAEAVDRGTPRGPLAPHAIVEDGCDDDGWFIGWCPLCDPQHERDGSAQINFRTGHFRCTNFCCHPGKRGTTTRNVIAQMGEA